MASISTTRVNRELQNFNTDSNQEIQVEVVGDNIRHLQGTIKGPSDSQYSGGHFKLDIEITDQYPFQPPKVSFITKIWHPNMSSATGAICLDILKDQWAAALTLRTVMLSIQALLAAPEPDDPQDAVVANQFKSDKKMFDKVAKFWTVHHAGGDGDSETKAMETVLDKILSMGFAKSRSIVALSQNNWELEKAVQWLSDD